MSRFELFAVLTLGETKHVSGCDCANAAIANTANKQSTTLLENANFKLP